nr:ribonuclease H-like domain-containing protein [Tanacetum cinerariifolium]
MEYWITNNDMNIWKVIQNGNSMKRTRIDHDGSVIILPPTTAEEHIVVQRESKAKNYPALVALTLKTKGGLELLSFDDLYYKLKILEVNVKGYNTFSSSQSAGPSHSAFVSVTSTSKKMSYGDSPNYSSTTTYSVPSNSKIGSHRSGNVIEDVLQSFVADTEPEQQLVYKDLKQIEKLDLEEMDLKWKMAMLSVRVHNFKQKARRKINFDKKESARFNKKKEIGKKEEDLKALITVDTLVDWTNHDNESDGVIVAKEFGMIDGCDSEGAIKEGAAKLYNLITGANSKEANTASNAGEFTLMGVTSESSTSCDPKYVPNDFVSYDNSDKSLEVNTNDFASSDSSVKSSEHQPNDSTSCASTSSVSTSVNEAEIESNVRTHIKEPIIVQDLPSFTCNSSDKNEHTSRTSCNKNGYFNKKACHFRKNALSVSKLCFICGSGNHLIKDCDFYEKQIANKTVVPTGKPKVTPVPTGKPKVTPVPTSKPKVTPVPTGRKVTFGGGEGRITRKGTIRTPILDFKNVYYVKELQQFNLFSISQICDKKNQALFTDTECLVLSKDFKLPDDSMVVLQIPMKHNIYTINLNNFYHRGNLSCLVVHASFDESVKWNRQMSHVNYKNMNRVSVTSPHNKAPYALLTGNIPYVSHFKPFGCHVTILNTSDHLGKFDGKADEGYIVGYFASNKAYRVYNVPNKRVEESMNLRFLEEKPNVQANQSAGTQGATTNSADTSGDKVNDTSFQSTNKISQKELASAKSFPTGCIPVPTGKVPVPTASFLVPTGSIPVPAAATKVSTDDVLVHTRSSTDSIFDDEPTTRLLNNE